MNPHKALRSGDDCPEIKSGVLRLYSNRFCPYAKRTRMVLAYKDIPHEVVNINLSDKPKWYYERINFLGTVPAIQRDDVIIFDSVVINEYLDSVFPDKKLISNDPYEVAKDKMLAEIWSKVRTQTGRMYMCSDGQECDIIPDLLSALDLVEKQFQKRSGPFLGGNTPRLIDFHIWPNMERITHYSEMFDGCDLTNSRFPYLMAWIEQMTKLPAAVKTRVPIEHFKMFNASLKLGNPDWDAGLNDL